MHDNSVDADLGLGVVRVEAFIRRRRSAPPALVPRGGRARARAGASLVAPFAALAARTASRSGRTTAADASLRARRSPSYLAMGIDGLHPFVASCSQEVHVARERPPRRGGRVDLAAPARATLCAAELAREQPTERFRGPTLRLLELLRKNGVAPLVVFDGAPLPMKRRTDARSQGARRPPRARAAPAVGGAAARRRSAS